MSKIDVSKIRLWNTYRVLEDDEIIVEKTFRKMKTKNELKHLAINYIINKNLYDENKKYKIDYIWVIE